MTATDATTPAPADSRSEPRRAAIVTGVGAGVGGIGRAIAARLASDGLAVMMADVDPKVADVAAQIGAACGRHDGDAGDAGDAGDVGAVGDAGDVGDKARLAWYAGDLSVEANVAAMVERTIAAFGRIDVLVNNAGGGVIRPFLEHDEASLVATLQRNLWTTIWCCHKVLPHMAKANHGRIVNIGADSLRTGLPQHAGYNAAKGGVIGLMVGLAKEFASYDITINTVSPCVVNTERHRARLNDDPALAEAFVRVVPKGRGVEIDEVCDAVSFLVRRETGFITGQDISLNGGSAMP